MPSPLDVLAGFSRQVVGSDPFPHLLIDALFVVSHQEAGSNHSLTLPTDVADVLIAASHQAAVATHHHLHYSL